MHQWKNLPFEVLAAIFEKLNHSSDVIECHHTCKNWMFAAKERIYRKVLIKNVAKMTPFMDTIVSTDAGLFVKAINLVLMNHYSFENKVISLLAIHCPNIESLTGTYIKNIWKDITENYNGGLFKRLQDIDYTIDAGDYHDYIETMLQLRKNMTKLFLNNVISNIDLRTEYKVLLQNLHAFPKLNKLIVDIRTTENIFALESMNSCSHTLKELKLTVRPSIEESNPNPELDRKLNLIIPRPSLENLSVEGVYLKPNIIAYLMHKFPKLHRLYFSEWDSGGTTFELPMTGEGGTMSNFFEYLYKMKSFVIRGKLKEHDLIEMIDIYRFRLLKEDTITVEFSCERTLDDGSLPLVELRRTSSKELQPKLIRIQNTKYLPAYTILKVRQSMYNANNLPSHVTFVEKSGAKINELKIEAKVSPNIILSIIRCCISLKALTISYMNLAHSDMANLLPPELQNSTIEILSLEHCDWLTESPFCSALAQALPSLKYLEFSQCMWMIKDTGIPGYYKINMPGIRFERLLINKESDVSEGDLSRAFLQINEDQFYLLGSDQSCQSYEKEEYEKLCQEKYIKRFHIICESIKTFSLWYPGENRIEFVNPVYSRIPLL